jgi:hypothetical protein
MRIRIDAGSVQTRSGFAGSVGRGRRVATFPSRVGTRTRLTRKGSEQ